MVTPQLLFSAFARAFSLSETLPEGASHYAETLQELRELQQQAGWQVIRVAADEIFISGEPVSDLDGEAGRLRGALVEAGIREIRLQELVDPEFMEAFFERLHPSSDFEGERPSKRFRGFEEGIGLSYDVAPHALPGMSGGIQGLFRILDFPPTETDEEAAGREGEGENGFAEGEQEGSQGEGEVVRPEGLPSDLSEDLQTYFRSSRVFKAESANRIRAAAVSLRGARDYRTLVKLVGFLVEAGIGSADDEAIALAEELTTPMVASCLVAQIALSSDEEERDRGAWTLSRIGPEGPIALRDALEESRERTERRRLLDAFVTLGPAAYEMAGGMVLDSRWYVVRNGVTILGELGGDKAKDLLMGTLANKDPRVRRESIMALTKIGGPDAEALVLGMLGDAAPQVRAAACRVLGAMGSQRAVKPILPLLKDKDQDTQIECLQALGHMADPAAVQPILKKAGGGVFSRPPRAVRIAAFRALAGIGTPEALRAVRKGMKDGDEEVRTVCKALIGVD